LQHNVQFAADCRVSLDSNLLLLFCVGMVSKKYIEQHKCLQMFTAADFDSLTELLYYVNEIVLAPNTLTEICNLAKRIHHGAHQEIMLMIQGMIGKFPEVYTTSASAACRPEFSRLELTDTVLLELGTQNVHIVTVDGELLNAAYSRQLPCLDFRPFLEINC
jgi:hypothetical protein